MKTMELADLLNLLMERYIQCEFGSHSKLHQTLLQTFIYLMWQLHLRSNIFKTISQKSMIFIGEYLLILATQFANFSRMLKFFKSISWFSYFFSLGFLFKIKLYTSYVLSRQTQTDKQQHWCKILCNCWPKLNGS